MTERRPILVVHADRKAQRTIHRILGATLHAIDAVDSLAQAYALLAQRPPALVVLDHRVMVGEGGEEFAAAAVRHGVRACLVLLDGERGPDLPRLFAVSSLTNLLGSPMPILAEELTATALKLLRGDLFGLEKYLSWGVEARSVELDDAAQRSEVVDALGHDLREMGLGPRVAPLAGLVADELLSNALFNAPIDEEGRRTRAHDVRHLARPLVGRERVRLRYACDARYLALEVTDWYGSLARSTILEYVAKCVPSGGPDKVDFRAAGAGLGIGVAYDCCNHLVFNLRPGHRTEVIGLLNVRFRPAELAGAVSSLNVFEEGSSE